MDVRPRKVLGKVDRRTVGVGSKSEQSAVVLTTRSGESFVLRRRNGPAFGDSELESLIGHEISAEGLATSGVLIMNSWRPLDETE